MFVSLFFTVEFIFLREGSLDYELEDSWMDFIRHVLGMEDHVDSKSGDANPPSFSNVIAQLASSQPSTADSDEELEHIQNKNIFLQLIPEWVLKSN